MSLFTIVANLAILISCAVIFGSFCYFSYRRKDLGSSWVLLLFSAFILFLGLSQLAPALATWYSLQWLPVGIKVLAVILSISTSLLLLKLLPKTLKIPNPAHLTEEIQTQRKAFWDLKLVEVALRESKNALEKSYSELENRVKSRTEEMESHTHELS